MYLIIDIYRRHKLYIIFSCIQFLLLLHGQKLLSQEQLSFGSGQKMSSIDSHSTHSPYNLVTSNFMNKIFVILRLITKFTKILCHENLELYGTILSQEQLSFGSGHSIRSPQRHIYLFYFYPLANLILEDYSFSL